MCVPYILYKFSSIHVKHDKFLIYHNYFTIPTQTFTNNDALNWNTYNFMLKLYHLEADKPMEYVSNQLMVSVKYDRLA